MPESVFSLLMLLVACLFFSCGEGEEAVKVSLDKRQEISFKPQLPAITYAYLPQYSNTESFQRHHRLVEYIAEQTEFCPWANLAAFAHHISMFGQEKNLVLQPVYLRQAG